MVEDRVTDSTRIAQLLASELTGLGTGPLADVAVVDADPDASPSPDGTVAYALTYCDRRVGTVSLYPDCVRVYLDVGGQAVSGDLSVPVKSSDDGLVLVVESGAAVKRAVDAIRAALRNGEAPSPP